MAKHPTPKEIPTSQDFDMQVNPNAIVGVQANESFMLRAGKDKTLGNGGETIGFAKYQYHVTDQTYTQNDLLIDQKSTEVENFRRSNDPRYETAMKEFQELKAKLDAPMNVAVSSSILYENKKRMANDPTQGGDRALLSRAVASKQVDNVLGMNSIAEEKFGIDANGKPVGISVQCDGQGITSSYEGKDCILQMNLKDPKIQKGLSDLEVQDYITGQVDRHAGNIFVDPNTGKVTGIDNDLSFPEGDRELMLQDSDVAKQKAVVGMPKTMHVETASKILATDPEQLRKALKEMKTPEGVGKLSDKSIDGAVNRLKALQAELKKDPSSINVVKKFGDNTYDAAINSQDAKLREFTKKGGTEMGFANLTGAQSGFAANCDKTSYLGAMALQEKRYSLAMQETPERVGVRPSNTAKQAARSQDFPGPDNPRFNEFQQMNAKERQQFFKTESEISKIQQKNLSIDQKINQLQTKPTALDKFKGLFQGGTSGQIANLNKEKLENQNKIDGKSQKLDKLAEKYKPEVDDKLVTKGEKIENRERRMSVRESMKLPSQKQSGGDLSLSQDDVSASEEIKEDSNKLKNSYKRQPIPKMDTNSSTIRQGGY